MMTYQLLNGSAQACAISVDFAIVLGVWIFASACIHSSVVKTMPCYIALAGAIAVSVYMG